MKPEQQLIAFAESLRWTRIYNARASLAPKEFYVDDQGIAWTSLPDHFPDYLNDLNALAQARNEKINTIELKIKWVNILRDVVGKTCERRNNLGNPLVSDVDLLFATTEQLAETFIRTIGKWKE